MSIPTSFTLPKGAVLTLTTEDGTPMTYHAGQEVQVQVALPEGIEAEVPEDPVDDYVLGAEAYVLRSFPEIVPDWGYSVSTVGTETTYSPSDLIIWDDEK